MLLVCLGSMPYTFGRVTRGSTVEAGTAPRRYEATEPQLALLPPFWAPHTDAEREQLEAIAEGAHASSASSQPGRAHSATATPLSHSTWLGTDRLGRSMLVRCLAGGAISLAVGLSAAAIAVFIGTLYGTIAGYFGGRTDALMMRLVDILYGLPYVLLVVLLAVAVNGLTERAASKSAGWPLSWLAAVNKDVLNVTTLLIAIGGVSWLTMARVIRGQVLSLKQQPFMEACRAIGVPLHRQFLRHLLPNLMGPIIVYATLTVPSTILSESFLSFLGIGVQEPLPSWGNLAAAGLSELNLVRARWWLLLWPCLCVALTLLSLNFVGEGLRERFDPKRRAAH